MVEEVLINEDVEVNDANEPIESQEYDSRFEAVLAEEIGEGYRDEEDADDSEDE